MQPHLAHMTQFTREQFEGKKNPERNMQNRKPFRSPLLKRAARDKAVMIRPGTLLAKSYPKKVGTYISDVPTLTH